MRYYFLLFLMLLEPLAAESLVKANQDFTAQISIEHNQSSTSSGSIQYKFGDFKYVVEEPYSQTIYKADNKIFIQDDDFQQVFVYAQNFSFLLDDVLSGDIEFQSIECSNQCYIAYDLNNNVKELTVELIDNQLFQIKYLDYKDDIYVINFLNYQKGSKNISYNLPEGYEVIVND